MSLEINILGAKHHITLCHNSEDPRMYNSDGFCDETTKEIFVENFEGDEDKPNTKKQLNVQKKKALRHEIIHAFAFESGLAENSDWAQNEEFVDWIAIQGPKILKAWQEAGAI